MTLFETRAIFSTEPFKNMFSTLWKKSLMKIQAVKENKRQANKKKAWSLDVEDHAGIRVDKNCELASNKCSEAKSCNNSLKDLELRGKFHETSVENV